jgi:rubredoxin
LQFASLASRTGIGLEQTADLKSGISIISEQNKNTDQKTGSRDDKSSICLCDFAHKETLNKCGHSFCAGCIDGEAFKYQKKCPVCSHVYGPLIGDQPDGRMIDRRASIYLPGFGSCSTIVIHYLFKKFLVSDWLTPNCEIVISTQWLTKYGFFTFILAK